PDVVVGTPIANRPRPELEQVVGFFANTLVLRSPLDRARTARDLVRLTRERALAAYAHQDLPFERLVEELHPQREVAHNPVFQILFALQSSPLPALELPGVA